MILVLLVCSVKPNRRPRPLSEHHTTCLQKSFNPSLTALNQTYGHWECYSTKCVHYSPHLMLKVCINLQGKLLLDSITMSLIILVKMSQIYFKECFVLTQRSGQILTRSLDTPWLLNVCKNFWMRMTLEMNSLTLFYTIKMSLMNSRPSKPNRKRKMNKKQSWPKKRRKELSKEWLNWSWTNTSPSTDKIRNYSMKCLWII